MKSSLKNVMVQLEWSGDPSELRRGPFGRMKLTTAQIMEFSRLSADEFNQLFSWNLQRGIRVAKVKKALSYSAILVVVLALMMLPVIWLRLVPLPFDTLWQQMLFVFIAPLVVLGGILFAHMRQAPFGFVYNNRSLVLDDAEHEGMYHQVINEVGSTPAVSEYVKNVFQRRHLLSIDLHLMAYLGYRARQS